MKIELLFIIFSLFAWAWLNQAEWLGIGLVLITLSGYLKVMPIIVTPRQFHRWGDACMIMVVFVLLYVYLIEPRDLAIFALLKSLPIVYMPLLLAQLLSNAEKIPLSTLFYSLRKSHKNSSRCIDIQKPYAALTMVSAGAANVDDIRYWALSIVLFTGLLGSVKPKQSPVIAWLAVIGIAIVLSFFGQQGLQQLQNILEDKAQDWFSNIRTDPFKGHTSIGSVGKLKISDRIVLRVQSANPLLLMQAGYDRYQGQVWYASENSFSPINPNPRPVATALQQLTIFQDFDQDSILPLPDGTIDIKGLGNAVVNYTPFATAQILNPPTFAEYQVFYSGQRQGLTTRFDLQVPRQHLVWLKKLSEQLKLKGQPAKIIAARIQQYFQQRYFYSLYQESSSDVDSALTDFVLRRKSGHCEYFAVATVFLLRYAGIPARLANGYAVTEYNPAQALYIVRSRHAHAWALAYNNGFWQSVDSTPAQWLTMENESLSNWQWLSDSYADCWFYLQHWQQHLTANQRIQYKLIAVLLLTLYLLRGWRSQWQITRTNPTQRFKPSRNNCQTGQDSAFYRIEQLLHKSPKLQRHKQESMQQWVERLQQRELLSLCRLHYQLRFDPQGLNAAQRQQLQQGVDTYLQKIKR